LSLGKRLEGGILVSSFARSPRAMNFTDQRMDGSEFRNCSLVNAVFDDVNLAGARLTNVNLTGLVIEDANIKGLTIFGYDVEAMVLERLRQDGRLPG
jgi:uncharacterized protein YjbI with pentapeptide repeats